MDNLKVITSEYKRQFIDDIVTGMEGYLDNNQLLELNKSLNKHSANLTISENPDNIDLNYEHTNKLLIKDFIKSKKIKGLSSNSLKYYEGILSKLYDWAIKSFIECNSDDLKEYLEFYKTMNSCSATTLNNTRRILSSFFRWLEIEEKIFMNPMKQIPSIKTPKKVRKAFTDEEVEILRKQIHKRSNNVRNGAIFELFLSSGRRFDKGYNHHLLFKTNLDAFNEGFQELNRIMCAGQVADMNRIRSHMMRKFHASRLYNDGLSIDKIDALQGRAKDNTHNAYFKESPEKLKEVYLNHMDSIMLVMK